MDFKSSVPSHLRSIRSILDVESWVEKLGLTTSHGSLILSPKYDMDVRMPTLFGGEAWTCVESWVEKKNRHQVSTQVP
jgi:hypothetical protein